MADALKPGDWVDIEGMAAPGRIASVDARRKTAQVIVRDHEWTLALAKLRPGAAPLVSDSHARDAVRLKPSPEPTPVEIDLHGMRVEDAIEAADRALDRAAAGGAPTLRIIHGHGTGRVRTAIRAMLGGHPHAAGYRFAGPGDGGPGSTIVDIRLNPSAPRVSGNKAGPGAKQKSGGQKSSSRKTGNKK